MMTAWSSPVVHCKRSIIGSLIITAVVSLSASAADVAWTGAAGNWLYATGGNWSGGVAPANNGYSDNAVFSGSATAGTVTVPSDRRVKGLHFTSVGWTLRGGSFTNVRIIQSAGSGTNTIQTFLNQVANTDVTWTVDAGNTLVINGYYQRNTDVTLVGGGTLRFLNRVGGYGSGNWGIHITDGSTVRVDASTPYTSASAGTMYIGEMGRLQLLTSVAAAESLITGGGIVDGTGDGLTVTDIGGGYVEIAATDPMPPIAGDWDLTFQEEFNGSSLDGTKWRLGQHWSGTNGSGVLSPEMVSVADGVLKLRTAQQSTTFAGVTKSYASSEVSSFAQFRQQYGYFEARVRYPAVQGLWPAFWLMPDRGDYGWKDNYRRSFLKFDLTGVSPGTISTAELKLRVESIQSGGNQHMAFMRLGDDSWSESTITWNNKPAPDPVWIASRWNTEIVAGQDLTVDVKDYIAQEMAGDKTISFVVADTYMRDRLVTLHSSEAANMAVRPRLVINGVTYYASEDADVRWGSYASQNFGSATQLRVKDGWGNTATTFSGGMEVDIMESLGIWGTNKTQHALHWDGYGSSHQSAGSGTVSYPGGPADDFHTYGVYWEPGLFKFYVDGVETWEWTGSRAMSVPAYVLLSHQLGGWGGNSVGAQVDDQVMEVDWVRVWSGTADLPAVVVVDNADATGVTVTGTWTASTATGGYYDSNYLHDGNTAQGSRSVRFTPDVPVAGNYQVFARWTAHSNRASNVPITIDAASVTDTVYVDQRSNGGGWVLLGTYAFDAGQAGDITISNTGTDGYVIADAVKLSWTD